MNIEGGLTQNEEKKDPLFHEFIHNDTEKEMVKEEPLVADSKEEVKEDSVIKLIDAGVTVKQEEDVDSLEYLRRNENFSGCEIGQIKTKDGIDIFYENTKIETNDTEPVENDASLNSDMVVQDKDSNEDIKPGSLDESLKDYGSQLYCPIRVDETKAERLFECKVCSKSFFNRGALVKHERIHTKEKPFGCKICSKRFYTKYMLDEHERTHTGEKVFKCRVCSKCFYDRSTLVKHVRIHTKPFDCKVCSKSFYHRSELVRHEQIHSGERSFHGVTPIYSASI